MQRNGLLLIGLLIISIGFLAGCTSEQPEYKMNINVENQFSQDIEGFIEITAHGVEGGPEDRTFLITKQASIESGETESVSFDIPESVSNHRFRVNFSAESGGYMSDSISKAYYFFESAGSQWLFRFKVYGTPPSMIVEFIDATTSD